MYVRARGGDTSRTYESLQGREGPKLDEIERTYFVNGRFPHPLSMEVVYITCLSISYECQFMPLVKSMITCSHLKKKIVKLLFHKKKLFTFQQLLIISKIYNYYISSSLFSI